MPPSLETPPPVGFLSRSGRSRSGAGSDRPLGSGPDPFGPVQAGVGVVLRSAGACCAIQPPERVHPGAHRLSRGGCGGLDRAVRQSCHELGPTGRLRSPSRGRTSGDLEGPAVGIGEAPQEGCCGLGRDRCSSRAPDPHSSGCRVGLWTGHVPGIPGDRAAGGRHPANVIPWEDRCPEVAGVILYRPRYMRRGTP